MAQLHIESGWVPSSTRVDELEAAVRTVCEPYFDRPLKEISLGMVLLRLFQTSRRFNVEIQPQLVLLQRPCSISKGWGASWTPSWTYGTPPKPFRKLDERPNWPASADTGAAGPNPPLRQAAA